MKPSVPIVAGVIIALFAALWAALVRVGWQMPVLPTPIAGQHGALMISAFLGTLISLERAVALHRVLSCLKMKTSSPSKNPAPSHS